MINVLFYILLIILFIYSIYKEKTDSEDFINSATPKKNDNHYKCLRKLKILINNSFVRVKWRVAFMFTILSIILISILENKIPCHRKIIIYVSLLFSCFYLSINYYVTKNNTQIIIRSKTNKKIK